MSLLHLGWEYSITERSNLSTKKKPDLLGLHLFFDILESFTLLTVLNDPIMPLPKRWIGATARTIATTGTIASHFLIQRTDRAFHNYTSLEVELL
jgi:hypothetical protein